MKTLELRSNSIVSQTEGNIVSNMGNEKVMLSVEKGKYYNLGEMGGVIWELIEKPITIQKLVDNLHSEYDVERSECEEQVTSFLSTLAKEGLIKVQG